MNPFLAFCHRKNRRTKIIEVNTKIVELKNNGNFKNKETLEN